MFLGLHAADHCDPAVLADKTALMLLFAVGQQAGWGRKTLLMLLLLLLLQLPALQGLETSDGVTEPKVKMSKWTAIPGISYGHFGSCTMLRMKLKSNICIPMVKTCCQDEFNLS